jgi:starch phosphorylase
MYPQGYLHQQIRDDGWQENIQEPIVREAAPINRVPAPDGGQLTVQVPLTDPPLFVGVWEVRVGRIALYLMDTDIPLNDPWNRGISARLYTGDLEQRLRQEIVLGIGGVEVFDKLGIRPLLLHLNEGHAAFALLEFLRKRIEAGATFDEALEHVRETSVFTTHTPVAAGHDVFPYHMMAKYFRSYWPALHLGHDDFMALGANPFQPAAGFNMTALALRLSRYHNAVSRRHAEVSRKMWAGLWAGGEANPPTVDFITNGVHVPTWIDPKFKMLFDRHLGSDWIHDHDSAEIWELVDTVPDDELWRTHYWLKIKLIDAIRERSRRRWAEDRLNPSLVLAGGTMLDPSVLTVGFARRFATYKRADLLLQDPERLKKSINSRWRPIQIIFAGKAHPADDPGKQMLQRVFNASRDPEMGGRIAFVEDYGEQLAQYLVHGVDIWLNNPLPPMEASGTSGMKAALNGVPQLSILDGWWSEGFNEKNGWAFEHRAQNGDAGDAAAVYRLLEEEVIPMYYDISEEGIPLRWVKLMKTTIKACGARFSARRMVKEYTTAFYARAMQRAMVGPQTR